MERTVSVNSRLQAIQIKSIKGKHTIGRELQSSCARKETVDIDILVTPRNDDRKGSREVASEGPTVEQTLWEHNKCLLKHSLKGLNVTFLCCLSSKIHFRKCS